MHELLSQVKLKSMSERGIVIMAATTRTSVYGSQTTK